MSLSSSICCLGIYFFLLLLMLWFSCSCKERNTRNKLWGDLTRLYVVVVNVLLACHTSWASSLSLLSGCCHSAHTFRPSWAQINEKHWLDPVGRKWDLITTDINCPDERKQQIFASRFTAYDKRWASVKNVARSCATGRFSAPLWCSKWIIHYSFMFVRYIKGVHQVVSVLWGKGWGTAGISGTVRDCFGLFGRHGAYPFRFHVYES